MKSVLQLSGLRPYFYSLIIQQSDLVRNYFQKFLPKKSAFLPNSQKNSENNPQIQGTAGMKNADFSGI